MKLYTIDGNYRLQLGRRMVTMIAKSPTLMQDLMVLRKYNIRIRIFKKGAPMAYFKNKTNTIIMTRNSPRPYKAISLAHEFVHAIVCPTQPPIPGKTGQREFVEQCLNEETEAIHHENIVLQELLDAGVKVKPAYMDWLNLEKQGGKEAIREKLRTTITSNTGEDYPEYYGLWYEEVVPKAQRLP